MAAGIAPAGPDTKISEWHHRPTRPTVVAGVARPWPTAIAAGRQSPFAGRAANAVSPCARRVWMRIFGGFHATALLGCVRTVANPTATATS